VDLKRKNWKQLIEINWTIEEIFDDVFSGKMIVRNTESKEPYNPIIDKLLFLRAQVLAAIHNLPVNELPLEADEVETKHEQTIRLLGEVATALNDITKNHEMQSARILRDYFDEFLQTSIYEIKGIDFEFLFDFKDFYDAVIGILRGCLFDEPDEDKKGTQQKVLNPFFINDSRLRGQELKSKNKIMKYINISPNSLKTFKNYEDEDNLPVHRMPGARGRLFAYTSELDLWRHR
jgi:hypothetical protein